MGQVRTQVHTRTVVWGEEEDERMDLVVAARNRHCTVPAPMVPTISLLPCTAGVESGPQRWELAVSLFCSVGPLQVFAT